jgi:hypothetical protein
MSMNNFGDETGFYVTIDELRVVTLTSACAHKPVPLGYLCFLRMNRRGEAKRNPEMDPALILNAVPSCQLNWK